MYQEVMKEGKPKHYLGADLGSESAKHSYSVHCCFNLTLLGHNSLGEAWRGRGQSYK